MEIFARMLHGSYTYLLIAQILVVTGLLLALLWLLVKRTRENVGLQMKAEAKEETREPVLSPTLEAEWSAKLAALEEETRQARQFMDENRSLEEKVQYLEKKLLEYEILQEEIGTLSTLKTENEQLKKELVQWKSILRPNPGEEGAIIDELTLPAANPPLRSESLMSAEEQESTIDGLHGLLARIDELTKPQP